MRDCAKRIVEKSKGVFTYEEAQKLVKDVDSIARKKAMSGGDYDRAVKDTLAKRAANVKEELVKQKANIARNFIIKKTVEDRINRLVESGLDVVDAFMAELEGFNGPQKGVRDSLDAQRIALQKTFMAKVYSDLAKEDLVDLFSGGQVEDQIGKALWELSYEKVPTGTNKQAIRIAEILWDSMEAHRLELNSVGADIAKTAGYMMPQRHDIYEMAKVGEDEWVKFMYPLLDKERSFGGEYESLGKALSDAYQAMITGIRLNDPTTKDAKLFQFSGPANLGKKLSRSRELHFKDYDSWKLWNEKFGSKGLTDGIVDAIHSNASNVALMSRYGTNPQAMLEAVASDALKKHRASLAKKGDAGAKGKIQSFIDQAVGNNDIPLNPKIARYAANIRAFNNLRLLGGAVISALPDLGVKSFQYNFQGKGWLESQAKAIFDTRYAFTSQKDKMRFLSMVGTVTESLAGEMSGKFSASDPLGVKMSKIQRLFFKLNGLSQWDDGHKFAFIKSLSSDLGFLKDTKFNELPEDISRLFGNYRIEEKDWDKIRAAATQLEDGRFYAVSENINDQKVARKLSMFFSDRANSAILTAGAREKRLTTLGTQSGSVVGEIERLVAQFKMYPLMVFTKGWSNAVYGKGKPDVPAMVALMMSTMLYGYAATTAKDLIKNRTPKDPSKPETYFAALAQGGGLGILGDLLLTDYSVGGRDPLQVFAGPTFGAASDVIKIYSAAVRGEGTARQAVNTAISYVPFNNLFYARTALDHLILTQMQEDLNPGYLRRMEQNMNQTYGQKILFK